MGAFTAEIQVLDPFDKTVLLVQIEDKYVTVIETGVLELGAGSVSQCFITSFLFPQNSKMLEKKRRTEMPAVIALIL